MIVCYHPHRQPSDATGPQDLGAFAAFLEAIPELAGLGASEHDALAALAGELRSRAHEQPVDSLTPLGQALVAASVLSADDLVAYLAGWAGDAVLAEEANTQPS